MSANDPRWRVSDTFRCLPCCQHCRATRWALSGISVGRDVPFNLSKQKWPCSMVHTCWTPGFYVIIITDNLARYCPQLLLTILLDAHVQWESAVFAVLCLTGLSKAWIYYKSICLTFNWEQIRHWCGFAVTLYGTCSLFVAAFRWKSFKLK